MQKKVCLGDLATYINGYAFKPSDWGQKGLPIIRIQNLTGNAYEVNYYNGDLDKRYFITNGDVLISWSASIGVYEWQNGDAWLNQHIFKVEFDKENVDKKYFQYAVGYVLDKSLKFAHGSTMKHLTKKVFDSLQVPYYDIDKQHQIVAKLTKIDKAIEYYEEIFDCFDKLIKSRFVEMFGEILDNGIPLAQLAEITGGLTKNSKRNTFPNQMPYLRVANVLFNQLDLSEVLTIGVKDNEIEKTMLCKGDLLFVEGNGSVEQIGRVAVWDGSIEPCLHQNHLIKARFNSRKINPVYALFYFMSQKGRAQIVRRAVSTSGLHTLSVGKIESLELPVPPIEKQNQFADFVALTDKSKLAVQQSIETLKMLKAKLMQDYFG